MIDNSDIVSIRELLVKRNNISFDEALQNLADIRPFVGRFRFTYPWKIS